MSFGGPQWPQEPQQQGQQGHQGYGYPPQPGPYGQQQQQPGHGQRQQPGYGQQQWQQQPQGGDGTPDWGALADASAAGNRRKRRLAIVGGVVATLAVGAVVA
ncbi:hypothetical protein AB1388_42190, partial [Streptomyces hydrogenans]